MKYLTRPWLVVLLGALAFGSQARADDFRVGFVNTDRIFREANTAKAAQVKLEQEFSKREKELNDLGAGLRPAPRSLSSFSRLENSCSSFTCAALAVFASRKMRSVLTKPTRKSSARAWLPNASAPSRTTSHGRVRYFIRTRSRSGIGISGFYRQAAS